MSGKIFSFGDALSPPALANGLNVSKYVQNGAGGSIAGFGTCVENAATTSSATLTDLVNYTGAGVLEFAFAMAAAASETARIQIIIDGIVVADATTPAVQGAMITPVGGISAVAASTYFAPVLGAVPFSKSLNIKMASAAGVVYVGARFRKHK